MLIEDARDEGGEDIADLEKIHGAGNHLLNLVDEVLDLSKIDAGKMELLATTTLVGAYFLDVAEANRAAIEKNGNRLEVELGPDLGHFSCDAKKVQQALGELIDNAAKCTSNGTITVAVERHVVAGRQTIAVTVRDTGIGIAEDQMPMLFEYFNGGDDSSGSKYGGVGLGLPLALKLCRLMGGDIVATSELGVGSCFTIELPIECPTSGVVVHRNTDEAEFDDLYSAA
jgi:signal transduction histidine kinase